MTAVRGPAVIRRRVGAALKQLRMQQGLHLQAVAQQLEVSSSKLSRLETGHVAPRIRDVRDLLEIYQAPVETRERIMQWAQDAKEQGWWQPVTATGSADLDLYISLEAEADKIRMYSLQVSGLLQTEAYARMILSGIASDAPPEDLDKLVEVRIGRQRVIDPMRSDAEPVVLHAVLDEAALHRGPTGPILGDQLTELLVRSSWPNVNIQVLPFSRGYANVLSTFAIFEPREARDGVVVNVESSGQDDYFDSPSDVAKYEQIWESVLARALDPEQSTELIRELLTQRTRS
jgi:transcriptional regulator with XRE-family HTH domain